MHTTEEALKEALETINKEYENNIIFDRTPSTNRCGTATINLVVSDNYGSGAYYTINDRPTGFACWHAHRDFFKKLIELCPNVKIQTAYGVYSKRNQNWVDTSKGNMMDGYKSQSKCCGCYYEQNPHLTDSIEYKPNYISHSRPSKEWLEEFEKL